MSSQKLYAETALADTQLKPGRAAISKVAKLLADSYKADNPKFRYDRFFQACGLDNWGELLPNPVYPNTIGKSEK